MQKVSDLLREAREEKGLKLVDIERATKIKKEFLERIEAGRYEALPSESYALGFVKNYAKYLDLPLASIVPLFRREYSAKKHVSIIPDFRRSQHKFNRKFIAGPRGFLITLGVLIIAGYIFFQYRSLVFAPPLEIISPKSGARITTNVVEVRGRTDPYATLFVNGDEVYVGVDGSFKKSIYEFSGNNKITVSAKNRFGKESIKVINVKVE